MSLRQVALLCAATFMIIAPGFGIAGIVRAVHNSQVNSEIERRHTPLPVELSAAQEQRLDIFFPLAPSPGHVEISYVDAQGEHHLDLDTREALAGLHLGDGKSTASDGATTAASQ